MIIREKRCIQMAHLVIGSLLPNVVSHRPLLRFCVFTALGREKPTSLRLLNGASFPSSSMSKNKLSVRWLNGLGLMRPLSPTSFNGWNWTGRFDFLREQLDCGEEKSRK